MYTLLILSIFDKALDITLQAMKDMPADQKAAAWKRHGEFMDFWQGIVDRLIPHGPAS